MEMLKNMNRIGRSFTWGLLLGIMMLPSGASALTWNFNGGCSSNCGLDGPDGNQRTFSSGGQNLTVQAFSTANSDGSGNFVNSFLGHYSGGLGVTSPGAEWNFSWWTGWQYLGGDGDGSGDRHTVDNSGKKDIVVFKFPTANYIPVSVYLSAFGDTDIDAWVGGNGKTFADFLGMSFGSFSGPGFTACTNDNSGSTSSRTANINCSVGGEYLIVAADKDGSTNDEFKIKSLVANQKVPEPSSLLLALFGLFALRAARGRKS